MKITDELLERYAPEAAEQMLSDLPEDANLPRHQFSPEFERKVRRMDKKARPQWQRWLRSAVAAVLACAILGGFFVTPAGAYVYEQVWQFVRILVQQDNSTQEYIPVQLGYLPDGFERASETELGADVRVMQFRHENGDQHFLVLQELVSCGTTYKEITTDGTIESVWVDGIEYYVITASGENEIIWYQAGYAFLIAGNLESEILLDIAKNILLEN